MSSPIIYNYPDNQFCQIGQVKFKYTRKCSYTHCEHNERTIELTLGHYFLDQFRDYVVEVGAVMPYCYRCKHIVIDPNDSYYLALRGLANEFSYKSQNVLSISTVEHMTTEVNDKINPNIGKNGGILFLRNVVQNANAYLITFPIGSDRFLESFVKKCLNKYIILKRINKENEWEVDKTRSFDYEMGKPYINGNAVCVITNLEEFFDIGTY